MLATEKITLTLPTDVMQTVRDMAQPRRQSQFIAEAIRYFVAEQKRKNLRDRLIAGYLANADADQALAAEWLPLEEEAWEKHIPAYQNLEGTDGVASSDSAW